jgi:hypothetical protein
VLDLCLRHPTPSRGPSLLSVPSGVKLEAAADRARQQKAAVAHRSTRMKVVRTGLFYAALLLAAGMTLFWIGAPSLL